MNTKTIHLDKTPSTQKYAKENVKQFDPNEITCITAEEQTDGIGRFKRTWISPKGNIYATFYFSLPKNTMHLISLAQIMTLTCAELLLSKGLSPQIKWPNDILMSGKKCVGVLCETSFSKEFVDIFLGIGINVNMKKEDVSQIDKPATSLMIETKKEWDKKELLTHLQKEFSKNLDRFKKEGFTPFYSRFENLMINLGEKITCTDGKNQWRGLCHSLTNDGQLNLCLENGEMKTISSGEIN